MRLQRRLEVANWQQRRVARFEVRRRDASVILGRVEGTDVRDDVAPKRLAQRAGPQRFAAPWRTRDEGGEAGLNGDGDAVLSEGHGQSPSRSLTRVRGSKVPSTSRRDSAESRHPPRRVLSKGT